MQTSRRYQDIAIINIERASKSGETPQGEKSNIFLRIAIVITIAVVLVVCGYVIGVHTGHIHPYAPVCCLDGFHLDLNFDLDNAAARTRS